MHSYTALKLKRCKIKSKIKLSLKYCNNLYTAKLKILNKNKILAKLLFQANFYLKCENSRKFFLARIDFT